MENQKVKKIVFIVVHLLMQLIFSRINIFNSASIGLPFAFISLYFGKNIFAVTGFYLLSKIYMFYEFKWVLITAYEIVFLALYYFANEFIKTNKKVLLCILFLIISNVLLLYFSFESLQMIVAFAFNILLQIAAFIYFFKFNITYKNKLIFYKFGRTDYLIFSIMVLLLSLGIFSYEFISLKLGLFVVVLFIIFSVKILPTDRYFLSVLAFLIGSVIASNSFSLFNIGVIYAVLVSLFKDFSKYFYMAIISALLAILIILFKIFDIFSIISVFFAILFYIFIPNKFINKMASSFEADALNIIFRKYQEEQIENVKNKLKLMSNTLSDMQRNFKFLLVGKIDREKACIELTGDIINKCCKECENFRFCYTENINKRYMLEKLLLKAIENKSISCTEVTNGVQVYCHKSGILASEINQMAKYFLLYESAMKTQDESKLMISSEIGNFANIFKNFANNIKNSLKNNTKLSKTLKEAFINNLVDVKDVMIFENQNGIESIKLIAANEQILKRELADSIAKTIKNQVQIKSLTHLEVSGMSLVGFIPKPKIKVQFSVSSKAKEKQNGDSAIITKITDNKYFVAIADGMGHGYQANKISSMVLNLIKSMFEVGLDGELIVDAVNKLLLPVGLENFTTLDACVVDLESNECTFIKLGSSVSILKHKDTAETIASHSLPIGIVQNVKPTVIKKHITQGDMIFLASDGVVDSFSSVESFGSFINDAKVYNVQKFLDDVIFDAENINKIHPDDMTIIGINLLKN